MLKFSYFTKARPCNVVRVLVYLAIKECFLGCHTLDSFSPSVQQSQTTACRHGPRYPTSFPPHFWTRTREEVVFSLHLPGWLILSTHQSHCWIIRLDINMNMNQVTKGQKISNSLNCKGQRKDSHKGPDKNNNNNNEMKIPKEETVYIHTWPYLDSNSNWLKTKQAVRLKAFTN